MYSIGTLAKNDTQFIVSVIESFQKLLTFVRPGIFGAITSGAQYKSKVSGTEEVKLSIDGYVVYLYCFVYKEAYPTAPFTQQQVDRINEIWDALEHPEKKISI
jgi:hypothetical protein